MSDGTRGHGSDADTEIVRGSGHENITAQHTSTLEVTSDDWLTPSGDCIVAVEADRVPDDFGDPFVSACRDRAVTITATFAAGGYEQTVTGHGHPELTFESDRSMVLRTSEYVDERTVMVGADTAAAGMDRELIGVLASGTELRVTFDVK